MRVLEYTSDCGVSRPMLKEHWKRKEEQRKGKRKRHNRKKMGCGDEVSEVMSAARASCVVPYRVPVSISVSEDTVSWCYRPAREEFLYHADGQ